MNNKFIVKIANEENAEEACQLLIRSIKEICIVDHKNDRLILDAWLSNKTSENIRKWINDSTNYSIVVLDEKNKIIGFSMISRKGEILLNYLLPEYLFQGIGKIMLNNLESFAKKSGLKNICAMSTFTAADFYKRNGYVEDVENKDEYSVSLTKNI